MSRIMRSLGASLALLAVFAVPAFAHHVDTAVINATCTSYTIEVTASELDPGQSYVINYTITGFPVPIQGSIPFTAQGTTYDSGPIVKPVGPFSGTFTLSGTATLVNGNTITMKFVPGSLSCEGPPPPGECTVPGSINSGFNGTAITGTASGPAFIWFNSNISLKNLPAGATVSLTNSHAVINGNSYPVPNAVITFANIACATTSYDGGSNTWITMVPVGGSDEIFLSGVAVPETNLPGGTNVSWDGVFSTNQAGICLQWKWGAAAYKTFPADYNAAQIKPSHSAACGMNNGDHAGAPQNPTVRSSVTGGARGGGGSNFTGSWSATGSVCPPCATKGGR